QVNSSNRLHRADEYSGGEIRFLRDDIEHVMENVNEVKIRMARWAEHDLRPCGSPPGRMAGFCFRAGICFGFDNPADGCTIRMLSHQVLAKQLPGNIKG